MVINGLEILRNAPMGIGGLDGASYHDGLLLRLVNTSISQGSFPVILVSSDRYPNALFQATTSWQVVVLDACNSEYCTEFQKEFLSMLQGN